MKCLFALALLCAFLVVDAEAMAGEAFCRWFGIGSGPGYHAYNGHPPTIPQTVFPGWYPVLLPGPTPAAPVNSAWPGAISPVDWSRPPAALQPWTGP